MTHVAPAVLSEFSRRRHEITAAAELVIADHEAQHGELSPNARDAMLTDLLSGPRAQHLALSTRQKKHFDDEHTWRDGLPRSKPRWWPVTDRAKTSVGRPTSQSARFASKAGAAQRPCAR